VKVPFFSAEFSKYTHYYTGSCGKWAGHNIAFIKGLVWNFALASSLALAWLVVAQLFLQLLGDYLGL